MILFDFAQGDEDIDTVVYSSSYGLLFLLFYIVIQMLFGFGVEIRQNFLRDLTACKLLLLAVLSLQKIEDVLANPSKSFSKVLCPLLVLHQPFNVIWGGSHHGRIIHLLAFFSSAVLIIHFYIFLSLYVLVFAHFLLLLLCHIISVSVRIVDMNDRGYFGECVVIDLSSLGFALHLLRSFPPIRISLQFEKQNLRGCCGLKVLIFRNLVRVLNLISQFYYNFLPLRRDIHVLIILIC